MEQQEYLPGYNPIEVYKCKVDPDMSVFDEEDIKILNRVSKVYGGLNGKQLEEIVSCRSAFCRHKA